MPMPLAKTKVTLMIVDDHAVVRQGTRNMLLTNSDIEVVCDVGSGDNLCPLIQLKQPDVILLDINLPGKNGLELLSEVRERFPAQKVILFTAHTDIQYIRKGIALHANGYLSKTVNGDELQAAIFSVVKTPEQPVYSKDVENKLFNADAVTKPSPLTPREHEILLFVAQGMTNRDIAHTLVLSVKTVDSHVAKLMKKLDMSNRAQLTAYAYEQGFMMV